MWHWQSKLVPLKQMLVLLGCSSVGHVATELCARQHKAVCIRVCLSACNVTLCHLAVPANSCQGPCVHVATQVPW
jgi:hypothetical protein